MREHGVSNFPDPVVRGNQRVVELPEGVDRHSDVFTTAERDCNALFPALTSGRDEKIAHTLENALKYAQCVRANGVPDFPDPVQEGTKIKVGSEAFPPDSPTMQTADKACHSLLEGD